MFMMSNITDITINLDEYLRNEHCSFNYLYWFRYMYIFHGAIYVALRGNNVRPQKSASLLTTADLINILFIR